MAADRTPTAADDRCAADAGPTSWAGLGRARWYAARAGRAVGTEHLLLALTDGGPGPAADALAEARVTATAVTGVLWALQGPTPGPGAGPAGSPPLSGRARAVLTRASAAAPDGRPGDEHVLAAVVTDPDPALAYLVLTHLEAAHGLARRAAEAGWTGGAGGETGRTGGAGGAVPR